MKIKKPKLPVKPTRPSEYFSQYNTSKILEILDPFNNYPVETQGIDAEAFIELLNSIDLPYKDIEINFDIDHYDSLIILVAKYTKRTKNPNFKNELEEYNKKLVSYKEEMEKIKPLLEEFEKQKEKSDEEMRLKFKNNEIKRLKARLQKLEKQNEKNKIQKIS